MNVAFVGTVEGSAIALAALDQAGKAPDLVITLPREAAQRHSDYIDLTPLARKAGSEVFYARDINGPETIKALQSFRPDLVLVLGWSQICRETFLSISRLGNIGFHPGPLPRMRGRAVIPWTILRGETATAASLFWLDSGVDSGPILLQEAITVDSAETARTLYVKQTTAMARMLPKALELALSDDPPRIAQKHEHATYCARRSAEDGLINWLDPADAVLRLIRAVGDPYPGAFTTWNGRRLIIDIASYFPDSHRFIGLPGQVQSHTTDGFVVLCGDGGCVHVTAWRLENGSDKPRRHSKLGTPF